VFSSADKSPAPVHVARAKAAEAEGPFFQRAGEAERKSSFFGGESFFPAQAKLEISQPDDPQEKEADAIADEVTAPEAAPTVSAKQEDEAVQAKAETSGARDASFAVQRAPVAPRIQRQEGAGGFASGSVGEDESAGLIQGKAQNAGMMAWLARKARGPPSSEPSPNDSFEHGLASSKGSGSPLPSQLRSHMETRFGADFAGVRVHTGSRAQSLSASIHAKAFTHGGDIYFNSGYYSPGTAAGQKLLAHELTHTIQQGASSPAASSTQTQRAQRSIQRSPIIHRAAESQRSAAVELARGEQGKVSANETGPDGKRMGWERLLEYFKTTFGEDRILPEGATYQSGAVSETAIKVRSTTRGDAMASDGTSLLHDQELDVLPSWCGIFALWALNKGGIPLKKWAIGNSMFPPGAAYPPGHQPQAGDIAWRREFQHYGLVASSDGSNVTTVNGNTSGDDNVGGQVQEQTHPIDHWFAFFDPASIQDGPLQPPGQGTGAAAAPVRSLAELRKNLFGVNPKAEETSSSSRAEPTRSVAAKTESAPQEPAPEQDRPELERETEGESSTAGPNLSRAAADDERNEPGLQATLSRAFAEGSGRAQERARQSLPSTQPEGVSPGAPREAAPAPEHLLPQARGPPPIHTELQRSTVQRGWLGDAWDAVSSAVTEAAEWVEQGLDAAKGWLLRKVRDFVARIPGYQVLCLILGEDPITGEEHPLTGRNLLEAGLDVLPLGSLFRTVMTRIGIFDDVATWLEGRIEGMRILAQAIGARFLSFWDELELSDVGDPEGVMERVASLLRSTIDDIVGFVGDSAETFLDMIKRVMIREIADFVRVRIPRLFPLLKVALGFDPDTLEPVPRTGANILDAFLMVSEEGEEQRRQMIETGTYQRIVGWIDRGIQVFSTSWVELRAAIDGIWNFVTIENLFSPLQTLQRIYDTFARPIGRITTFLVDAAREILRVIKRALMARLSAFARETRGYTLLTVIIGSDPFTGEEVPRTMENVIRGFMGLMDGGEQQYEQLKQSGAIARIVDKVNAAVDRLNMTPRGIIQLFIDLWNSFSISDLAHPIETFTRIVRTFGEPIARLVRFVIEILMIVCEAVLILMGFPFDLIANIIANARAAWDAIKADVPGFFKNILKAIKQGFTQFFDHIGTHLLNGVIGWLMSELADAGIPPLTDFSLRGVIGWVLEVLGISMEKIWEKLAAHPRIGPQRVAQIRGAINTLTGIWTFIQDVRERGVAAIWEKIQEQLSNLWSTVIDAVKDWVMEKIISTVVTKLLSMLDPTGIMAVVNSAIAIYNAIQSFIRYFTQMLQIVNKFVAGIREIAEGSTQKAADFLEGALEQGMTIAIGFLANQVGLGGVGRRVGEMIERVRGIVDQAIGWLVNKAVDTGFALLDRVMAAGRSARDAVLGWLGLRKTFTEPNGQRHQLYFRGSGAAARLIVESDPRTVPQVRQAVAARVAEPGKEEAKAAYDRTGVLHGEVEALQARLAVDANYPTPQARTADENLLSEKMDQLKDNLGLLMPHLQPHPLPTEAQVTMPAAANNHAFATSMVANRIYNVGFVNSKGSEPSQAAHALYDPINVRRKGNGSYYIRGHLLNHNLGGPGLWSNMTALCREGNSRHEKDVESKVKQKFNEGKVIHYEVHAGGTFAPGDPPATAQEAKSRFTAIPDADAKFTQIVSLLTAERAAGIPTELRCEAHTMKYEGANWVDDELIVQRTVNNPVEDSPASYQLAGAGPAPVPAEVNVNTTDTHTLQHLPGVGPQLADRIVENGPYASFDQLTGVPGIGPGKLAAITASTHPRAVIQPR
jgi:DNA uptake protein ComE-like DNA-binding protein